ncbi:MAG: hypothetical protein CM15mP10_2010 [Actinomycetota bacterium]|nr:MAG: hypothetical protein CM15mP10_2010 [Actinomycetota bacterium]
MGFSLKTPFKEVTKFLGFIRGPFLIGEYGYKCGEAGI